MKDFFQPGELRVKICGITNPEDAKIAIDAGADALGFNLFPHSKRHVELAALEHWIGDIPSHIARVAVVVNALPGELHAMHEKGFFDAIQFHGDETPEFCLNEGGALWIRAIRVDGAEAFDRAPGYASSYLLFDAFAPGAYGGTGVALDWGAVAGFRAVHEDRHTILAGGLTPENVSQAVGIARPHAVDVASGVEASPGKKDATKVMKFIREAKKAAKN